MGAKIYSLIEEYSCSNCKKVYKKTSRDLNYALSTERIYLGQSNKVCSGCGKLRNNSPYSEYFEKSLIEKILLHLGFFTKYRLMDPIISFIEMGKDSYAYCFNTWDYMITTIVGFLSGIVFFLQVSLGIFIWISMSIIFVPFGLVINNYKIYKSLLRKRLNN